mmetsp:Transcript_56303/g.121312  ORF Transcript_56303/g.121312 Transcript_56303/m.121312 type:complete len:207 (-) Transcript_56303:9-629(-)
MKGTEVDALLGGEPLADRLVERVVVVSAQDPLGRLVLRLGEKELECVCGQPSRELFGQDPLAALATQQKARRLRGRQRRHGYCELESHKVELLRAHVGRHYVAHRRVHERGQRGVRAACDVQHAQRVRRCLLAVQARMLDAEILVVGDEHELGLGGHARQSPHEPTTETMRSRPKERSAGRGHLCSRHRRRDGEGVADARSIDAKT